MAVIQVEQDRAKRSWHFYLIGSLSFVLTLLLAVAIVYFLEEIQKARGYGYLGSFVAGVAGGITIVPFPSLLVVFTLGHVLNPLYVGLLSGLGEALGSITTYLTGAGVATLWSRLRSKQPNTTYQSDPSVDLARPVRSEFWSKGEGFYNRLLHWVAGKGGPWVVFIASVIVISPFYFVGLAAGSLRMGLLRFFLISWAGKTVKGLITAFGGYWGLYFLLRWIGI